MAILSLLFYLPTNVILLVPSLFQFKISFFNQFLIFDFIFFLFFFWFVIGVSVDRAGLDEFVKNEGFLGSFFHFFSLKIII